MGAIAIEISGHRSDDSASQVTAGGVKCISCGHPATQARAMTGVPVPRGSSSSAAGGVDQSDNGSVGSNSVVSQLSASYLTDPSTLAVLHRNAGLKSLQQHYDPQDPRPLRPVTNLSISNSRRNKRPSTSKEPLYRKARLAAQLREIPKIRNVDFGRAPLYALDDEINFDDAAVEMSSSQKELPGVRLPQVQGASP